MLTTKADCDRKIKTGRWREFHCELCERREQKLSCYNFLKMTNYGEDASRNLGDMHPIREE
jgi:hypothetical protein